MSAQLITTSRLILCSVAFCGVSSLWGLDSSLRADDPPAATSPPVAEAQQPENGKVPELVIEHDPKSGQIQMFLKHPNGQKQPIHNLDPQLPLSAQPIPPELADYFAAIKSLAAGERYIIGVELKPIPEGLHARLGLKEESGLLVASVIDGKPAADAGVKQHDLLMKINGKSVQHPGEVVRIVNESKSEPITLTLLRDAEPFDLEVTPTKATMGELQTREEIEESVTSSVDALPPNVRIVGPGMIVPGTHGAEMKCLHKEVSELRKDLQTLSEQVKQLQEQLAEKAE